MSSKKQMCLNWILLLVTSSLCSIIAEGFFRALVTYQYRGYLASLHHPLYEIAPSKDYVLRMRPNTQRVNKTFPGSDNTWAYRINPQGFRGAPFVYSKDSYKLLFLGDSYTFGWAVNDEDVFPEQVKRIIRKTYANVDVYNLGVPGYSTYSEEALLKDWAPIIKPDLVVLAYVMNDAEPQNNAPLNPCLIYQNDCLWMAQFLSERLKTLWERHFDRGEKTTETIDYLEGFEPRSWKWKTSRKALQSISILCKDNHIGLLVVILPDVTQQFGSAYRLRLIHEKVSEWGREFNVPTFDLLPYFDKKDHENYWVPGEGHPNADAHKLFAEIIAEKIMPWIKTRVQSSRRSFQFSVPDRETGPVAEGGGSASPFDRREGEQSSPVGSSLCPSIPSGRSSATSPTPWSSGTRTSPRSTRGTRSGPWIGSRRPRAGTWPQGRPLDPLAAVEDLGPVVTRWAQTAPRKDLRRGPKGELTR